MIKNLLMILLMSVLCFSCVENRGQKALDGYEDTKAKEMLQGIWTDDDSNPFMEIIGDTIYYADSQNAPVCFKIIKDSLYMYGNTTARYRISKQTNNNFWFFAFENNLIKLSKSENENDSLVFFSNRHEIIPMYTERTQKDSVVYYNNVRYRAYVYINPSSIKVVKTGYSDEGLSVDNTYFDNVIHICVYEGKKSIYAKDIKKQMFEGIVPSDFLAGAILSDVLFVGVNSAGFKYQASVCMPESYVCNLINLTVGFDGKLNIAAVK